ncbi:MAG: hypothetical protein HYY93_03550 [Planctomycetes bacterium]|nr:hypothetical protein [Planctomycetota bacterium]
MARAMYDLDRLPDGPSRRVLQPARPVEGGTLVASYEVVEGRTESTGMLVPLLARASFTTPRGFVASWAIWATVSRAPDGRGVAQTWEEGEGLAD